MKLRLVLLAATVAVLVACASKPPPPPPYVITDFIPAGSCVDYFAQVHDGTWKRTMTMRFLPRPMHIGVAEKWAMSAAQQKLGGEWKDYRFEVTPPERRPVVIWQRSNVYNL